MMCASPFDARTCDVMVRTSNTFPSQEACTEQVRKDFDEMGQQNVYARYKCFEMQEMSI